MTTTTDVQNLYTTILRRDGTDAEVASFVAVIDSGVLTLAQTRLSFIDSTEANTYTDAVIRLYQAAFGRQPDTAGFTVQVQALKAAVDGGTDIATATANLAAAFSTSTEFTTRFGTSTTVDQAYLTALYLNVLGRSPSGAEIDAWIATGDTRAEVLKGFSNSAEFITSTNSDITQLLDNTATGTALVPTAALSATTGGSTAAGLTGTTFTLTTGVDTLASFTGTSNNDTFNAGTSATFSAFDKLDGGAGTDSLTALITTNILPGSTSVVNIETVTINTTASGFTGDFTGYTGLTSLTLQDSAAGAISVTASSTTDLTITGTLISTVAVIGGGLTLEVTTGVGAITVGGSAVANAFTSATLTNTVGNNITIQDRSGASAATGSTLTTVSLSGGAANTITSDGLTSLTITAATATTTIVAAAATRALVVSLGANTTETIVDATATTATVTSTSAHTIAALNFAAATSITVNATANTTVSAMLATAATSMAFDATGGTLTVTEVDSASAELVTAYTMTGTSVVTVGGTLSTATTTVTSTNTGGVSVSLTGASQAITASFGSGADTVTALSADDIITTGAGNDTVTTSAVLTTGSVDAGAGTDILIIENATHVANSTVGAKYSNFETLTVNGVDQDVSLITGIVSINLGAATSKTISGLSAAQAAAITVNTANTTSSIFTLTDATGSTDSITLNLASATSTTNVDVVGASVIGIETVIVNATTGTDSNGDTAFGFLANTADSVTALNFTGTADVTFTVAADTLDVVAVAIDASSMTGTADFTLVQTSNLVKGSSVTGTLGADVIALGTTNGNTYSGGAGNDSFTGALAVLVATGTDDTSVNGGAGTDTVTLSDTTSTLTDNHFTFISNMETLALTVTSGALSLTTGAAFNAAFASGITITTGQLAASVSNTVNVSAGLATVGINITVDATLMDGAGAAEDILVTTGSGVDTITITGDDTWVGVANGDGGTIAIDSGSGIDTISITVGTILAQTTSQVMTINAGTGADLITVVKVSANIATSVALYTVDAGDSLTTAQDVITGFDIATASIFSDGLDFSGTATVGALATEVDTGTILTHAVTLGVVTFDDAATFVTAIVINSANLATAVAYLAANSSTNMTFAFTYDSDDNGSADATMVYHNGTTDSLVQLVGVTAVDRLVTTNASEDDYLFIA